MMIDVAILTFLPIKLRLVDASKPFLT